MIANQLENSRPSNNTRPSNGLLILLAAAVLLTLWTFLQSDDVENTELIELADAGALKTPQTSTLTQSNQTNQTSQVSQMSAAELAGNAIPTNILKPNSLKREPLTAKPYNLFKVHSWVVVPPVKKVKLAPPPPPPPPVAPPAPFVYMGKLENSTKNAQIFLVANGKLYTPQLGEKIDMQWRLDAEDANALRLTYLPLNLPQVLSKSARPLPVAAPVLENVVEPAAEANL